MFKNSAEFLNTLYISQIFYITKIDILLIKGNSKKSPLFTLHIPITINTTDIIQSGIPTQQLSSNPTPEIRDNPKESTAIKISHRNSTNP